jgi:myo-inositol 2-dehydrogenase / D-chiro-inositol 1-dehydrogenase
MTAILGRMASYNGKVIPWDEALASEINLCPKDLSWNGETLVKPGPDGIYPCAMPGSTKVL